MSFLRSMWKNSSKHKKLCEELALANSIKDFSENHDDTDDPSDDAAITYAVKYIGNTPVESSRSEAVTADAVKKIIAAAKSNKTNKSQRVSLAISPKGIEVTDSTTGDSVLQVSIYRISYCSADAAHSHVFAFIESSPTAGKTDSDDEASAFSGHEEVATSSAVEGKLTCHAFMCQKRKMAQTVTLTVARSFERAYQIWQNQQFMMERQRKKVEQNNESNAAKVPATSSCSAVVSAGNNSNSQSSLLIDFNTELAKSSTRDYLQNTWVSFEDDTSDDFHQLAVQKLNMPHSHWDQNIMCS